MVSGKRSAGVGKRPAPSDGGEGVAARWRRQRGGLDADARGVTEAMDVNVDRGRDAAGRGRESLSVEGREQAESQDFFDAASQPPVEAMMECGGEKGKGRADDLDVPFRFMDLPAELRLHVYRCWLVRPFDILLHKDPSPPAPRPDPPRVDVSDPPMTDSDDGSDSEAQASLGSIRVVGALRRPRRSPRTNGPNNQQQSGLPSSISISGPTASPAPQPSDAHDTFGPRPARTPRPQDADPLQPVVLRLSKQVYKEARAVLYADNAFELDLASALPALAALHQRSRSQIARVALTIPSHHDILDRFSEVVRLSIRYCWHLRRLHIVLPFHLPGAHPDDLNRHGSGAAGQTLVYANAFNILRWLPRGCEVVLEGDVGEEIRRVVGECATLARSLDERAYARRQLINETERLLS